MTTVELWGVNVPTIGAVVLQIYAIYRTWNRKISDRARFQTVEPRLSELLPIQLHLPLKSNRLIASAQNAALKKEPAV